MAEEQLSPEEKLLKVIQDGGGGAQPSEPAVAVVETTEPVAEASASEPVMKLEAVEESADEPVAMPVEETPSIPAVMPVVEPVAETPAETALPKIPPKSRPKLKLAGTKGPGKAAGPRTHGATGSAVAQETVADKPRDKAIITAKQSPATGGMIAAGPLARVGKKTGRKTSGITLVNRALAVAALILVGLAAWEVWANIQENGPSLRRGLPGPSTEPIPEEASGSETRDPKVADPHALPGESGLVPLDKVLKLFEGRDIFGLPPEKDATVTTRTVTTVESKSNWEIYARGNLKLKGLSVLNAEAGTMEAIVADAKAGKLFFLKKGDEVLLDKQKITVEAVEKDQLTLTDGVKKIGLK